MAMADNWPSTLPQRLIVQGYMQGLGDGRLRTQMDSGPAKVRLRSKMPAPLAGTIRMSSAQVLEARAFVEDTLLGGTLPFGLPDPLTRERLLVRFVDLPSWSCVGGDWYDFAMSLEVLP